MNRMLSALAATFAVMLLTLSPASAGPYYGSELICLAQFEDKGYVWIDNPTGNLDGYVQTAGPKVPPPGRPVFCEITCDNAPPSPRLMLGPVPCGATNKNGVANIKAPGLGAVGPSKPALFCRDPIVRVFDATIDCTSGYPTPQ